MGPPLQQKSLWCSKGMMSREFTGHVHVGEWSAGSAALALGLVPLFFGRVQPCLGADVDRNVGVKRLIIPGHDLIFHRIHTIIFPCVPGLSQHVKPA